MEGEGRHWLALLAESEAARSATETARAALEREVASLRRQLQSSGEREMELRQGVKRVREQADARYRVDAASTRRMFVARNLVNEQARNQVVDEQLDMLESWRLLVTSITQQP